MNIGLTFSKILSQFRLASYEARYISAHFQKKCLSPSIYYCFFMIKTAMLHRWAGLNSLTTADQALLRLHNLLSFY